ncbi:50S ribosomal protein L29 [Thermoleophilum album]|uniref:50S ribosomal protein L29 n=1 Tax=Thermoleophilum album TaxID=29539 RepID=UPI000CB9847F|nr:50S ribosomal protein L29 [Thermoleophilum album]WDT93453.1 50S ribosomal protein L29 [Thermoleophilum album]GBD45356.1 50S ribosomal protein L29 [bacterium HR41]
MKPAEVRQLDDRALVEFIDSARQELFNLRFQHAVGQLENTARIKQVKKDIARGLTVARERGIDVERELAALRRERAQRN